MKTIMPLGIAITIAVALSTPVHSKGNPPGVNPTHYQCYKLEVAATHPMVVKLQDQFGISPQVKVEQALYLCAPTMKNNMPITDKKTHYLCYQDEGVKTPNRKVRITNQFGVINAAVLTATWLCVPSLKQVLP
jgi:hypothetical protein